MFMARIVKWNNLIEIELMELNYLLIQMKLIQLDLINNKKLTNFTSFISLLN